MKRIFRQGLSRLKPAEPGLPTLISAKPERSFVPANPRRLANDARDRGNWPAAAYHYGIAIEAEPGRAELRIQHANMLKESGLLEEARAGYEAAIAAEPGNSEPVLQLAILAKLQGRFEEAIALFNQGLSLGYPDHAFVTGEVNFLRRTTPAPLRRARSETVTFFLSARVMPVAENDPVKLKAHLGMAHYSYGNLVQGYRAALESIGMTCEVISHPEYMPDLAEWHDGPAIHIGFYPPDEPRFLKGAYNVTCVAWEFERLRTRSEAKSYHAFSDATTMLNLSDEVWAISEFSARAITRSGVRNTTAVPSPVVPQLTTGRSSRPKLTDLQRKALSLDRLSWTPLAIFPSIQPTMSQQAKDRRTSLLSWLIDIEQEIDPVIYLCVMNVHDYRKQAKPMLEAFVRFAQDVPDALLLLKVTYPDSVAGDVNAAMFIDQVADPGEMTAPLVSERIIMTTDALSREEMDLLFQVASYYVCTSHAEGQNLPLLEAMGWGAVPLSVDHTAMGDYITAENAIVIPSELRPLTPRLTGRYGMYGIQTHFVEARDVFAALSRAHRQTMAEYAAMSAAAVGLTASRFGTAAFGRAVDAIVRRAGMAPTLPPDLPPDPPPTQPGPEGAAP